MNYELALKLKEAGFPQFTFDTLNPYQGNIYFPTGQCLRYGDPNTNLLIKMGIENGEDPKKDLVYAPTLSELIEACPKKILNKDTEDTKYSYFCLEIDTDDAHYEPEKETWVAGYNTPIDYEGNFITMSNKGSTPEEAVARLWLELNKK